MTKTHSRRRRANQHWIAIALISAQLASCGKNATRPPAENTERSSSSTDGPRIIEQYRALDGSHDSTIKMRATINGIEEGLELNEPRRVQLTMYRKRMTDGRVLILIEFAAPAEERDRNGLITVFPDGRIEAVRYVQSTGSFIVTSDPTTEEALFGMTPQEMAGGQPDKYDFTLVGEDTNAGTPAYRMEGKLKHGAESKFPRLLL